MASESGGLVDRFRFEIPPEWTGPFSLEPDVPYEIRDDSRTAASPGYSPLAARGGSIPACVFAACWNWGPMNVAAHRTSCRSTPSSVERFFVLPTQLDQQRIDWETPGLVEVPLPDVVPDGAADAASQVAYRVWAKPRAVIADVQRVAGERQISLADVYLDCRAQQHCFGVVSFAIEPAGAANLHAPDPREPRPGAGQHRRRARHDGPAGGSSLAHPLGVRATAPAVDDRVSRATAATCRSPTAAGRRSVDRGSRCRAYSLDAFGVRSAGGSRSEDVERHRIDVVPAGDRCGCGTWPMSWPVPPRRSWTARWAISRRGTRRGLFAWRAPERRISQDRWLTDRDDRSHGVDSGGGRHDSAGSGCDCPASEGPPEGHGLCTTDESLSRSRATSGISAVAERAVATHYSFIGQMPGLGL